MLSNPPDKLSGGTLVSGAQLHLYYCVSCTACMHICCCLVSSVAAWVVRSVAALWQILLGTVFKLMIIICCQEACLLLPPAYPAGGILTKQH